jgi:hypothetical protein
VLIDEIETSLHPRAQRRLMRDAIANKYKDATTPPPDDDQDDTTLNYPWSDNRESPIGAGTGY